MSFSPPVAYTYNPLEYARKPHEEYLSRFGTGKKEALLLGMNPGPFGMAQTGVPFGDVRMVRDWMGIEAKVVAPRKEHPKRRIQGFACPRKEVSGERLWTWGQEEFSTPRRFFKRFFVWNYCPLCFMEESGRNRTPEKLPSKEREGLFDACDSALRAVVKLLQPEFVVGIGAFALGRAQCALSEKNGPILGKILHPSPASPVANRGWKKQAVVQLRDLGISV
jgi:single-strand selective monofunctional uracil DNA glycosylase